MPFSIPWPKEYPRLIRSFQFSSGEMQTKSSTVQLLAYNKLPSYRFKRRSLAIEKKEAVPLREGTLLGRKETDISCIRYYCDRTDSESRCAEIQPESFSEKKTLKKLLPRYFFFSLFCYVVEASDVNS